MSPLNLAQNIITTDYESSAAEDSELYSPGKYKNADSALLAYSRTNKLEKLNALLGAKLSNELNLNLNHKGQLKQNFSWSALHLACYFGHQEVVHILLSNESFRSEININIQNNSGDTPLHKAVLTNRVEIVQLLLSYGANVLIKNSDGLLAKQLTNDKHILEMLEAAEQVDKNRVRVDLYKAVDNGDLDKLREQLTSYETEKGSENGIMEIREMVDERGNSLLHLATMRGFEAICVFLLEKGFDPYKKNNIGQSSIDLSSYQLRQLFANVKPSNDQLKKLSKQRVTRFEGTLLKKVRILGWKQTYVVLENGVVLLFNNRRDSMNKSRRGYKYLESAICEPDIGNIGAFTICFSDKSRATFMVTERASNQVELIRQKWIDSVRDHIRYSTDFIRSGLKMNDDQERYDDDNDLSNLNHLLPLDTIKEFIQEARAHYSILERHAESLCGLIQAISSSSARLDNSHESAREGEVDSSDQQQASTSTTTSGRLMGLFGPYRSAKVPADDPLQTALRRRSSALTNEFLQDEWHCILFHLRLLMESSGNTKTAMSQAIALMEHQEQIRQNRLQDQEERCRLLEDSLHALARDHHELEKSISMSHLYQSANVRSMSMSTDLNEYFDAFEEFDDEKTMTPSSMPSDEDLSRKIQEVMDNQTDDDDDLLSNCSALTVETISENPHSTAAKVIQPATDINTCR